MITDEEKNVKIAEVCGTVWEELGIRYKDGMESFGQSEGYTRQKCANYQEQGLECELITRITTNEEYFDDLNAMHEAETHLLETDLNKWLRYDQQIESCSPARQRAEAFGKTLGLW